MVKTVNMEFKEYEQDLNMQRQLGICDGLNDVHRFLVSKLPPSAFFGPQSLDPRQMKCKLMLDILSVLNIDPIEIQKVTVVIPQENKPTEAPQEAEAETTPEQCTENFCGSETPVADEAPSDQPVDQ